ncbi:MAG: hypothetical protein L6Q78_06010 [Bacteroidia bacterium]|nr:hypothetical protein [Bacteroidia bacterium]
MQLKRYEILKNPDLEKEFPACAKPQNQFCSKPPGFFEWDGVIEVNPQAICSGLKALRFE